MVRRGFTLIELLIVIAVLALLVALTTIALRTSSQRARTVRCQHNVRGLVLAMLTYDLENQSFPYGFYPTLNPPEGGFPGDQSFDRLGWWWFNFTGEYYRRSDPKKTILRCPSRRVDTPGLTENMLWGNYGVNRAICKSRGGSMSNDREFVGRPLRSTDILNPDRTLLIVDSGYSLISWWNVTADPPFDLGDKGPDASYIPGLDINVPRNVLPGCDQDAVLGRHPNRAVNTGFAGGHVESLKARDFLVEKTGDSYGNMKPLWWPETLKTRSGLP